MLVGSEYNANYTNKVDIMPNLARNTNFVRIMPVYGYYGYILLVQVVL